MAGLRHISQESQMKHRSLKLFVAPAMLTFAFSVDAPSATFSQAALQPGDLRPGAFFGRSVAAAGQVLAAGAFTTTAPGAVYVYQRNGDTWTAQSELHAPNPAAQDEFGLSVATDGTTLVVGAIGTTYILVNNNNVWTTQAQLGVIGISVAVNQYTVAVAGGGQVYVFRRNSGGAWNVEGQWAIPAATTVALDANTLVVGAPGTSSPLGNEVGAAFVFARNNAVWTEQATLTANDPAAFAQYGFAAGVSGDTAVIGAPGDGADRLDERTGSAYVYVRNNGVWTE
jgi:hypothetical protein